MDSLEQVKNKNRRVSNPTGKGGFADRPQDINYGGRPKNENSPTYWLRNFLNEVVPNSPGGKKRIQAIAERLAILAYEGDIRAMREVFDRLDGKAPQTIKHQGDLVVGAKEVAERLQSIFDEDEQKNKGDKGNS